MPRAGPSPAFQASEDIQIILHSISSLTPVGLVFVLDSVRQKNAAQIVIQPDHGVAPNCRVSKLPDVRFDGLTEAVHPFLRLLSTLSFAFKCASSKKCRPVMQSFGQLLD